MSLLDNLVSYFKLDEASGNASDARGSNTLTDNNSVGSGTGKIGNARSFTASSLQFLSHASNSDLTTGDIDFTISAWVNLSSKAHLSQIVTKWDDVGANNDSEYSLFYLSGTDRFRFDVESAGDLGGTVVADTLGSPSTSTWYFVVAWHDSVGNSINIQVNNGGVDSTGWGNGVRSSTSNFKIGSWDNPDTGRYMDGLIDEVGFWKRVLTSTERTRLYGGGNGLAYPFISKIPVFMNQYRQRRA